MADALSSNRALQAAIDALGSQGALAELVGVGQPAVSKWVRKGQSLPAEYVLLVERRTGVSRHDLRPDIYPRDLEDRGPSSTSFDVQGIGA